MPSGWRSVAQHAGGIYASINQHQSAVADIAAPQDKQLRELNAALNDTYVPFGRSGAKRHENQLRQDNNAAGMSVQAAERAVTKAGKMYRSSEWDLVDALESGMNLDEVDAKDLPAPMRTMNDDQREAYVKTKAEQRQTLRTRIQKLGADRDEHIAAERERSVGAKSTGFADAMKSGLRAIAEKKGFNFGN